MSGKAALPQMRKSFTAKQMIVNELRRLLLTCHHGDCHSEVTSEARSRRTSALLFAISAQH
jgi:hypothetical protein